MENGWWLGWKSTAYKTKWKKGSSCDLSKVIVSASESLRVASLERFKELRGLFRGII